MESRRTPESKERLLNIVQMRLDGYTIQQIADNYGVTKQCIQEQLSVIANGRKERPKGIDEKIVFPNLAKWISKNKVIKRKLSKTLGMTDKCTQGLNMKLYGERDFSMTEIKKLLEITGHTFEYLFAEKAVDDETDG